jgi:hypothetical protein
MRAALQVWQSFYCDGQWTRCERHKLRDSGQSVPARLLPNGRLLDDPTEELEVRTTLGAPAPAVR